MESILAAVFFGLVGFFYIRYGKKMGEYPMIFCGLALWIYPYFFSSALYIILIGSGISILPFILKKIWIFHSHKAMAPPGFTTSASSSHKPWHKSISLGNFSGMHVPCALSNQVFFLCLSRFLLIPQMIFLMVSPANSFLFQSILSQTSLMRSDLHW